MGFSCAIPTTPRIRPTYSVAPPALHMDIKALGRQKVMMLLLADRDALGSKGGNKGYVGDQFFAIDPGHALEKSLLSKRGDVHSDLSFDAASVFKGRDYKNFTVFDQTPFAEKMEGVRHLTELKKSGEDTALFDTYAQKFGSEQGHDALDFSEDLLKTKEQYIGRRDDILNAFASRLAVDNYSFGEKIDADPAQKATSRDQTLNLLADLGRLPNKDRQAAHQRMLVANSGWRDLAGGTLCTNETGERALLRLRLDLNTLSAEVLTQWLMAFVVAAESWAERLLTAAPINTPEEAPWLLSGINPFNMA